MGLWKTICACCIGAWRLRPVCAVVSVRAVVQVVALVGVAVSTHGPTIFPQDEFYDINPNIFVELQVSVYWCEVQLVLALGCVVVSGLM